MKHILLYGSLMILVLSSLLSSCSSEEKSVIMPVLLQSNPENEAQEVDFALSEIVLTFNKKVCMSASDLEKLQLSPSAQIENISFSDEIVTVQISGLTPETQYTLTIPGGLLIDDDNNSVGEIKILFKTKALPVDKAPDNVGMENDAYALFKKIKVGWNLGNSLESYEDGLANHMDSETSWGNPIVTKEMIDAVKNAGFNAVRIPVRWYPHVVDQNTMAEIRLDWLARVKEVVDYCIDNDMYVILNTHHEDWLESHPLKSEAETVLMKEKNLWHAIASYFRDYDERLIFSGTNEVEINWQAPTAANLEVQNRFNQCFVDAVRATGGKNYYRNLIIQTYATNPDYAFDGNTYLEHFKMPAGVRELGFNAFMSTNLKEIDLPETIEEFGRNTFNSCFELKDVYMRHKEAPYWISWCVFANKSSQLYRTLHLYPGSKAKYDAHPYTQYWIKYFDNVVEDLEPTGIHSVTLDKNTAPKAIYDLNGRRIQNVPSRGIYIQNGKKISAK